MTKPRFRGVSHQYAFFVSALAGILLVASAPTAHAALAAGIYAVSVSLMLGTSTLYHRVRWSPRAVGRMARLDYSMICVSIAGSYTPIALLLLDESSSVKLMYLVWGAALVVVAIKATWSSAPNWIRVAFYIALGSVGLAFSPEVVASLGGGGSVLLGLSCVSYVVGGLVYALKRPDPYPTVFGYHEVFHALVIVGAATHFALIAIYVMPRAV